MSNRVVVSHHLVSSRLSLKADTTLLPQPAVYRTIMNDVIENVRTEFDEVGVEEAVLNELLRSWEAKVAMSRVADFSLDSSMGPIAANFPPAPPGQPQPAVLPLNGVSSLERLTDPASKES